MGAHTARSYDILTPDFYKGSNAHEAYAWMRQHDPVHWDSTNELWAISRYDDVVAIEKDKATFINSDSTAGYRPKIGADSSIIGLDDPEHTKRRMLVSRSFTPRAVGKWEDEIRGHVLQLLDAAAQKGSVEVVADLASPLPAMMIGKLLGYPHDMWPKLKDWSERTIQLGGGPMYHNDDGIDAVFEFADACAQLYEGHKQCPIDTHDDVMNTWIKAEAAGIDGYDFGLDQIIMDCLLLLDGGAETTRTVIGRTILNLIEHPEQWAALRAGADMDVAVEEFVRFVTPVHNMCRTATRDAEVGNKTIKAGQQVALIYPSANRDSSVFDNSDVFDVTRVDNPHIAFGFGTHFCLGASLARLEIKTFFEEFVDRFEAVSLTPGTEVIDMANAFVHGLRSANIDLSTSSSQPFP
ncbi:MAG: cytochrome P450 [Acidimicrobiales bacterium]